MQHPSNSLTHNYSQKNPKYIYAYVDPFVRRTSEITFLIELVFFVIFVNLVNQIFFICV